MKKNILLIALSMTSLTASAQTFQLNSDGYYNAGGTSVFRIAGDVYERGVWQPVIEHFHPDIDVTAIDFQ